MITNDNYDKYRILLTYIIFNKYDKQLSYLFTIYMITNSRLGEKLCDGIAED